MATTAARPKENKDVKAYVFTWEGKDRSGKIVKGEIRASGENIERPGLKALATGDRCRLVEPRTEPGQQPVEGCYDDLDAVVDRVLHQEESDAYSREAESSFGQIDGS